MRRTDLIKLFLPWKLGLNQMEKELNGSVVTAG